MNKRSGRYPNERDFAPNFGVNLKASGKLHDLPLSDPSESQSTASESFQKYEDHKQYRNRPSAFSENKNRTS